MQNGKFFYNNFAYTICDLIVAYETFYVSDFLSIIYLNCQCNGILFLGTY